MDPKFSFHHPGRPELKRVYVEAPIENEVAERGTSACGTQWSSIRDISVATIHTSATRCSVIPGRRYTPILTMIGFNEIEFFDHTVYQPVRLLTKPQLTF